MSSHIQWAIYLYDTFCLYVLRFIRRSISFTNPSTRTRGNLAFGQIGHHNMKHWSHFCKTKLNFYDKTVLSGLWEAEQQSWILKPCFFFFFYQVLLVLRTCFWQTRRLDLETRENTIVCKSESLLPEYWYEGVGDSYFPSTSFNKLSP